MTMRKQPSCVGHSFQGFAGPYLVSPMLMLGLALSGAGPLLDVRHWVLGPRASGPVLYKFSLPTPKPHPHRQSRRCKLFVEVAHAKYAQSDTSASATYARDVRWPKFVGTGTERNAFPFKKDLSLSSFFSFFLFPRTGLSTLSNLSLD